MQKCATGNSSTIETLTAQFLEQGGYLRGWSPKTIRTYGQSLGTLREALKSLTMIAHFRAHLRGSPLNITKASLAGFVVWMRQKGFTTGGCNVRIRTVNSFLTWLHEEGHTPDRLKIKVLRNERKTPRTIAVPDIRKLIVFRPKPCELRTWTLCVLLLDTGLRIDEALGLERKNADLGSMVLKVLGKGSKERLVPLSTEGRKHLFRLLQKTTGRFVFGTQNGTKLRYRNAYRDIQKLSVRLGLGAMNPHGFRHSFAVNYIRQGGDIYRLSRILGHASLSTTQLYLRSMGIEQIKEGHDALSALAV